MTLIPELPLSGVAARSTNWPRWRGGQHHCRCRPAIRHPNSGGAERQARGSPVGEKDGDGANQAPASPEVVDSVAAVRHEAPAPQSRSAIRRCVEKRLER